MIRLSKKHALRTHIKVEHSNNFNDAQCLPFTKASYSVNGVLSSCVINGGHFSPTEIREILDGYDELEERYANIRDYRA